MADHKTNESTTAPLNIQSLLAIATVVGGIFLFSQNLSTSRTSAPPSGTDQPLGDQQLERRLWEDPLASTNSSASPQSYDTSIDHLLYAIREHSEQTQLLPVLVPGGSFSEDQENRIRSRFAIISALGQSGYVPEDAEHIGEVRVPWPSRAQIKEWKALPREFLSLKSDPTGCSGSLCATNPFCYGGPAIGYDLTPLGRQLRFAYEWYRPRQFHPGGTEDRMKQILVFWLPENSFEDDPVSRLVLFLRPFASSLQELNYSPASVSLIGPWRSSTLREMVQPDEFCSGTSGRNETREVLRKIAVFSATASAMDEVLLPQDESAHARESVKKAIEEKGFRSFHNFSATDAQLAGEITDELRLRGADPTDPRNHIVLLSDWDTFYGRMLTLTYAAELEHRQSHMSIRDFIAGFRAGERSFPANYHYYSYLRGMDGLGIEASPAPAQKSETKRKPSTVEDIFQWVPEDNKAEGGAQFDYLIRLAHRLADLEYELGNAGDGSIKAIGIAGSDVYDILLVLQALRPRFPNALFFTTDLDARFLSPKERAWTQNLIISSSYGFELHPDIQLGVAPFRDSTQTAQYAAAMAALGNKTLLRTPFILPRRYEIGRETAVNLSTNASQQIHPLSAWERKGLRSESVKKLVGGAVAALALSFLLFYYLPGFRRISWDRKQHQAQLALYELQDLGSADGVRFLLRRLARLAQTDPVARWVWDLFLREAAAISAPASKDFLPSPSFEDWLRLSYEEQRKLADLYSPVPESYLESIVNCFFRLLNKIVRGELNPPEEVLAKTVFISEEDKEKLKQVHRNDNAAGPYIPVPGLRQLKERREVMDKALTLLAAPINQLPKSLIPVLAPLGAPDTPAAADSIKAAECARRSSLRLFELRRLFTTLFWVVLIAGGAAFFILSIQASRDTFHRSTGEPFNLTNGISAWPTEFLRLIALLLAAFFFSRSYYVLKTTQYELTRKYRFTLSPVRFLWFRGPGAVSITPRNHELRADELWAHYQQHAFFPNRISRASIGIVLFLVFGSALMTVAGYPLRPIRGDFLLKWDAVILWTSVIAFLAVTFCTIHCATLAQWFVEHLSEAPTQYPDAAREHFSRERGNLHHTYIDEWIDVQLIADLTEAVGRLIYAPFILFSILLLSRNSWWDNWGWTYGLVIIFIANLVLAAVSVLVLQRGARKAKSAAEATLEAKVKKLEAVTAASPAHNNATQAEKLLQDIRHLKRGAFVPFWQNPLVAAILVPSGGTVLVETILLLLHR